MLVGIYFNFHGLPRLLVWRSFDVMCLRASHPRHNGAQLRTHLNTCDTILLWCSKGFGGPFIGPHDVKRRQSLGRFCARSLQKNLQKPSQKDLQKIVAEKCAENCCRKLFRKSLQKIVAEKCAESRCSLVFRFVQNCIARLQKQTPTRSIDCFDTRFCV